MLELAERDPLKRARARLEQTSVGLNLFAEVGLPERRLGGYECALQVDE